MISVNQKGNEKEKEKKGGGIEVVKKREKMLVKKGDGRLDDQFFTLFLFWQAKEVSFLN